MTEVYILDSVLSKVRKYKAKVSDGTLRGIRRCTRFLYVGFRLNRPQRASQGGCWSKTAKSRGFAAIRLS